jgi:hypothetical protein
MNFKQHLAKFVTGNLTTGQLPEIGLIALQEGLDAQSLRILAGMGDGDSVHEIDHYFRKALDELNIQLPEIRNAALIYASAIVDEIVAGEMDIIAGVGFIRYDAIDRYDFFSESIHYCYDSIKFDKVYGLYVEYNEIEDGESNWVTDKTKDQLLEEVEAELFAEIKKWQIELKNHV